MSPFSFQGFVTHIHANWREFVITMLSNLLLVVWPPQPDTMRPYPQLSGEHNEVDYGVFAKSATAYLEILFCKHV